MRRAEARTAAPAALAGLLVLAMLVGVLALRWSADFSNVDDYLYARQTDAYLDSLGPDLVDTWKAFGQNAPLVPTLALPIAATEASPDRLVLVQAVFVAVLFLSVSSILARLGAGPWTRWLAAGAITALPPVLAYAAMYHFGLAATALTALAAAAYLRSERLRRRRPALLLGAALGLLAITRVVAPVYVAALAAAIAVDCLAGRERRALRVRNAAVATAAGVVVAAPWWLLAGPTALDYLTSAGYGDSPFTTGGSALDVAGRRFTRTADELGWLLAVLLAALTAWTAFAALRRRPGWRAAAWLLGVSAAGFAALATSSNAGTAFAFPLVVLLACAAVWGVMQLPLAGRALAGVAAAAAFAVSALALFDAIGPARIDGRALWQVGTPGLGQARAALGCECDPPDSDAVADRVLAAVGERPVMLARDDAVLNAESLRYRAARRDRLASIVPVPPGGRATPADLDRVDFVIAGRTLEPYQLVDGIALALSLRAARFRPALRLPFSRANEVTVWAAPGATSRPSR